MNWREEYPPLIDVDESLKDYVKGELKSYYLYLYKWHELEKECMSLGCSTGGSIIQMPDGWSDRKSPQQRYSDKLFELEEKQKEFEQKLDKIDRLISVLNGKCYDVTKEYVMKRRCKNAKQVGNELKIEEDTVKKYAERAISQICSRNSNIL